MADHAALRDLRNDRATQEMLLAHPEARSAVDDTLEWLERRSNDPTGAFLVIEHEGCCAGFVQLTGRHGLDRYAHFGIAISSFARGSGVGAAAMAALFAHASDVGLRKLLCEVRADNESAIRLYSRLGFRAVGTLAGHYDDGVRIVDVVVMERMVDSAE